MSDITRKEFLRLSALMAGAAALPASARAAGAPRSVPALPHMPAKGGAIDADLIVVNGRVLTSDPAMPRAEAFAVRDGRFLAIGSTADIRNLASSRTRVIDAARMTVVPGFIDAHNHPGGVTELYDVNANLRSIGALKAAITERVAKTPPGYWVDAYMFDDTKLTDGRPLHRRDLDEVAPNHPVGVHHRGGHTGWYNSKAFELAKVTKDTPDPTGGRFFRDADGTPNGWVAELATDVFDSVGLREQFTPAQDQERRRNGMAHMSSLYTAAGLTTVHDLSTSAENIRAYEEVRARGELRHRAYMMIRGKAFPLLRDAGVSTGFGDEWVRVGGVKYAADGSASERTMRMSTPFQGTTDYGILTMSQAEIHDAVDDAHSKGWQVGIHANGDVTIDMVLTAYERALARWPHPDRRHRIEHCSLVNPSLIARIVRTGSIPTPFWTYIYYHGEKWEKYGDAKMESMFAHKSFLDAGIKVPGASDYGPGPFEPLMALQSMVTRTDYRGHVWGANQRVTIDQALTIATQNGAYASYEEHIKGSITTGKLADFVILERDPHDVPPDTIKDIRIVRTVTGGRTVFPKNEA
ncbi:MAG: amidohydrolase [Gemmatimonadaceae bacterium]|nr:amidohydrolase [Gemmatimonadaceae bacterium]